jgi:hypothetical protein
MKSAIQAMKDWLNNPVTIPLYPSEGDTTTIQYADDDSSLMTFVYDPKRPRAEQLQEFQDKFLEVQGGKRCKQTQLQQFKARYEADKLYHEWLKSEGLVL